MKRYKTYKGVLLFIMLLIFLVFAEKLLTLFYNPIISVKRKTENHSTTQTRTYSLASTRASILVPEIPEVISYMPTIENRVPNKSMILNRDRKYCSRISRKHPLEVPPEWKNRCPDKPIVTVMQMGRLGNQIWEYVSVWVLSKITGREPFVPSCIIQTLEDVFKNLTAILPLKYIENCPIRYRFLFTPFNLEEQKGDIVLPLLAQLPHLVVPHLKEVLQLLQFHDHLTQKSQDILRNASRGMSDVVYVSVHVRRTDYTSMMSFLFTIHVASADFFLRQMNYFRQKYSRVLFVILSDDPDWCENELSAKDAMVVRGNSPEQDLSLLASCNHSILDYGTYGLWGAIFAGGETRLYKLAMGLEKDMVNLMPNWYAET